MSVSIETHDKTGVLAIYELHKQPHWSLWQGNRLVFSTPPDIDQDECIRMLDEYLDILEQNGSTAIFCIRFHKNPTGTINNKTEYIGSCNVRMYATHDQLERRGVAGIGSPYVPVKTNPLQQEFNELKEQVKLLTDAIKNKDTEDEENFPGERTITGIAGMIEDSPVIQGLVMGVMDKFGIDTSNIRTRMAGVGSVNVNENTDWNAAWNNLTKEQKTAINGAILVLTTLDRDFAGVIVKLAAMAKDNPGKYNNAKSFL